MTRTPTSFTEPVSRSSVPSAPPVQHTLRDPAHADELSDAELESVVGGLARSYIAPPAHLTRRIG